MKLLFGPTKSPTHCAAPLASAAVALRATAGRHVVRHRIGARASQSTGKLEGGEGAIVHAACESMWKAAAQRLLSIQQAPPQRQIKLEAAASLGQPRPMGRFALAGQQHRLYFPIGANGRMEAQAFNPASFFEDKPPPSWSSPAWSNAAMRPPLTRPT